MSKPGLVLPFAAILALAAFAAAHAADPAPCLSGPAQEAAFRAFADQLLVHKDARGAYGQYAAPDLVQRNPPFGASLASTITQWETMTGLDTSRFEIQSISFDGDVATVAFRGLLKPGQPGALVTQHDRLRCGRIVEEWAEFKVEGQ